MTARKINKFCKHICTATYYTNESKVMELFIGAKYAIVDSI